jgi:hydroxymethylglutaryl-CoA reductase (NADPH)
MTIDHTSASDSLEALLRRQSAGQLRARLEPHHGPRLPRLRGAASTEPSDIHERWNTLAKDDTVKARLLDAETLATANAFARNIENFVGTVKIPVGIAGPVRVNGTYAHGDYYVPLATTEAALVASYNRGALLISEAGGCSAIMLHEGMIRAPGFAFDTLAQAGEFVVWCIHAIDAFRTVAHATSRHGRLRDMRVNVEGNNVYLIFEFTTGEASGQNMVTIATQAICQYIEQQCPVQSRYWFVEANHSGDKKASHQSFLGGRGRSVTGECIIPRVLVERYLHTTPEMMANYWRMSAVGGVLSGTIGVQGHYANGLAAVYMACGQDVACVAESAVGVTRYEITESGDLYASVTLPNLVVGTIGGGSSLPSQRACLDILGLSGDGSANAFAEVCAALSLAGELSIVGALVAGHFTSAHEKLARGGSGVSKHAGSTSTDVYPGASSD